MHTVIMVAVGLATPARAGGETGRRALGVSGDVGVGGMAGQAVTTLQTGLDIQEGSLSLGLFGRVRILMQDDPDSGPLRRRDWDEASDYVHILRYLHYRRAFDGGWAGPITLTAQAGELLGYTLGHGTLVRDYSNIADPDHPHAGVHLAVEGKRFAASAMLDNVIAPAVIASRVQLQPVGALSGLVVGTSAVVDPQAPVRVITDATGERVADDAYNLQAVSSPLLLLGVDLEYAVIDRAAGKLLPYADLNTSIHGLGVHVGGLGEVALGDSGARLSAQAEYRASSDGYAPTHVGTFYDVERLQAGLGWSDPRRALDVERSPKLTGLVRGDFGGQGAMGQLGLALRRHLQLKVGASYQPGPDAVSLWWRAASQPLERLNLGLLMVLRGVGDRHDEADGLMAMAEGRYRLTDDIYALAQYSRTWSLSADSRYFQLIQSFNLSIGAAWSG